MGLSDAGLIGRIRVHPKNPELVYLAALGHGFGKNEERGVFRTKDGGVTWERVLFLSDSVGAVDLAMNPANPRILFAGMWRAERKPWTLIDASEDGGVYRSKDGGDNWEKLENGLPKGLTGRIGISVSPANPDRIWAIVNAHDPEGGVYRSDDGGDSWSRVNRDRRLRQRHWYYSHIVADPVDDNTVYAMNTGLYRSVDGGRTWEGIRVPHGDVHDLWINPDHPDFMVVGNDGGAQVSLNAGASWSTLLNQPTAELYRVITDDRFPYRLYAAQQDNSTISLPSRVEGGLTPYENWFEVGGCESGHIAVDPENPDVFYAGCYIGEVTRVNRRTGEDRMVMPYPVLVDGVAPRDLTYRFQWNAPIVFSPHDPDVLYTTSNHVHRTTDEGMSWEVISPDLTADDETKQDFPGGPLQHDHTSVEVYGTVFAFAESPHTPGVLWAGSDDGRVQVSRNHGVEWSDVTPEGLPPDGTVNTLEISPHQEGRVFLAVQRYRMDDFKPYVYRTDDFGESWQLLTNGLNGIPADHPVRVVREDPNRRGLLFAGTEFGLFVSFDDGAHWQSFQQNLPITPVTDLQVKEQDLVVATQGRSLWILDDLSLLHQLSEEAAAVDAFLFAPGLTHRLPRARSGGDRQAQNPPNGAVIRYHFREAPDDTITLDILDSSGNPVRSFSSSPKQEDDPTLPKKKGVNRFVWDLAHEPLDLPDGAMAYLGYTGGATVVPGEYEVRLTAGGWSQTQTLRVLPDPRMAHVNEADLLAQLETAHRIRSRLEELYSSLKSLRSVRDQAREKARRAEEGGFGEDLKILADSLEAAFQPLEEQFLQTKAESGQDPINFPPQLDNQFGYLYRHVAGAYGRPTAAEMTRLEELESQLASLRGTLQAAMDIHLSLFNAKVQELGVPPITVPRL
ncbi:WD40/YVTN/BNR-like repeat-containing protein [Gemmatimonadota bacterium]